MFKFLRRKLKKFEDQLEAELEKEIKKETEPEKEKVVEKPDPDKPGKVYNVDEFDFRLRHDTVAVDAGCVLPNVNDSFTGKAPDLGAYEIGLPLPIYGPRP